MAKELQTSLNKSNKSKQTNPRLVIYNQIKEGTPLNKIIKNLNLSKKLFYYYLSSLKQLGLIQKVGYGTWETTNKHSEEIQTSLNKSRIFSLGTRIPRRFSSFRNRPKTNLHALQINFPILEGTVKDTDWNVKEKLKNWIPKYTRLEMLGGLTIKNNNNHSLTVFVNSRNISTLEEVDNLSFQIRAVLFEYFKNKHGVILDVMNCQIKNLNLGTQDKTAEGMLKKGESLELDLNKKSEKIFNKDDIDAKAWIDGSPFKFTAETNDKEWKRAYLTMPFAIMSLTNSLPAIQEYNKNILLHMKVQEEQLFTQKSIREGIKGLVDQVSNLNDIIKELKHE